MNTKDNMPSNMMGRTVRYNKDGVAIVVGQVDSYLLDLYVLPSGAKYYYKTGSEVLHGLTGDLVTKVPYLGEQEEGELRHYWTWI
jgi:hypothetical protein